MKWGIILAIMFGLLVGTSSGGILDDPTGAPSWASFGIFDDNKPITFGTGWIKPGYQPFNLSDWLYPQPGPADSDVPPPLDEPVPLVVPEPLPQSKEELFGSLTTLSANKQSLLVSQKNTFYFF